MNNYRNPRTGSNNPLPDTIEHELFAVFISLQRLLRIEHIWKWILLESSFFLLFSQLYFNCYLCMKNICGVWYAMQVSGIFLLLLTLFDSLRPIEELYKTPCGHVFCDRCIYRKVNSYAKCPTCKAEVFVHQLKPLYQNDSEGILLAILYVAWTDEQYN